jgi:hypothetical protein
VKGNDFQGKIRPTVWGEIEDGERIDRGRELEEEGIGEGTGCLEMVTGEEIEDGGSGVEEEGEFIGEEGGGFSEEIEEGEAVDPLADEHSGAWVEGDGVGDLRVGEVLAKAESGGEGEAFGDFAGAAEAEEFDVDEATEGEVAGGERGEGVEVLGEGEEAVVDELGKRR